jgi:sugar transferase (PEP-CTERM/EpsH1 system associated)
MRLRRTVRAWSHKVRFDAIYVFCSSMGQYLRCDKLDSVPAIVDLVDVDSQKWFDYAAAAPKSLGGTLKRRLFEVEGRRVRHLERELAAKANAITVVSESEADLLRSVCPDSPVYAVGNGVDLDYFAPDRNGVSNAAQQDSSDPEIVFVGVLDYRPNVDGVCWFSKEVWPIIRDRFPTARFTLVGRRPASAVLDLVQQPGVRVAADVPDVRPFLSSADVVVVPLAIARGVQNKVLEAAAMGKPIVASPQALEGLELVGGDEVLSASTPAEWVESVGSLLGHPQHRIGLGRKALERVRNRYNWESRLSPLDGILARAVPGWTAASCRSVESPLQARLAPCLSAS